METDFDDTLEPGMSLGAYVVWQQIGSGGMGEVYEAYEEHLNRRVALKVIAPKVVGDADSVERFRLEGQALARLTHPNIIAVYSLGFDAGRHYLAMEFVEGQSLHDYAQYGIYGVGELMKIFGQLLAGTHAAHVGCVIHRDLKPKNVLITKELDVKIVDFGIAKLFDDASTDITQQGYFLGTVRYVAPEITRGAKPTAQSDIFSLGVIFYELLVGTHPFVGQNDLETLDNIKTREVEFPQSMKPLLPSSLQELVLKMMHKDPAKRYGSLAKTIDDFRKITEKDFPDELLKPTPHASQIENPEEVGTAVRLLGLTPLETRIVTAIAARLEQERSSGGFQIEDRGAAEGESDATTATAVGMYVTGTKFRITPETIELAVTQFRELRDNSELSNTRKFRMLEFDEENGPVVDRSDFNEAMRKSPVPPPVRTGTPPARGATAPASPLAAVRQAAPRPGRPAPPRVGTGIQLVEEPATAVKSNFVPETDPESTQTTRLRVERGLAKQAKIEKSIRAHQGGGAFRYVLGAALAVAVVLFGADHLGYMDKLVELASGETEQKVQGDFKIRKRATPQEQAAAALVSKGRRESSLPTFEFGDEFRFRHNAMNGKGFRIVTNAEMRYAVVGMVGDRVSWNVGDQATRTTSRNPFYGDLDDHTVVDAARSPSSVVYTGDSESFFPLRTGTKMELRRAIDANESYRCETGGVEKVVVPAGEFEATRIDCKTAGGTRYREETFHYAEAVGYWVQRKTFVRAGEHERTDIYALTSFKRAPASK